VTLTAAPESRIAKYADIRNFVGGQFTSPAVRDLEVLSPSDGSLLSRVPLSSAAEVDVAVRSARKAFTSWSTTPIKERVQVFYRYRGLLERNFDELASLITEEHGKIRPEAEAEVIKAIELTEFACSLPQIVAGEVLEVSRGIECRIDRHPVGIVASIVPFNFPSMVPHWTIPNAIVLGNCMILKPSELVPLSAGRIAELLAEAGLPAGVFNVVHGGQEVVEAICDHPEIAAVSFVGSTRVAKLVYRRATGNLKRALTLGGGQEPSVRAARRRSQPHLDQRRRLHVGVRRPALHGRLGDAGGGGDRPHRASDGRARPDRDPGGESGARHIAGGQRADRALHR
jgi:malonate-semialdehyde dehydrogenase (acetylating)/methylmalonate-semialdehyde dehydrogenase